MAFLLQLSYIAEDDKKRIVGYVLAKMYYYQDCSFYFCRFSNGPFLLVKGRGRWRTTWAHYVLGGAEGISTSRPGAKAHESNRARYGGGLQLPLRESPRSSFQSRGVSSVFRCAAVQVSCSLDWSIGIILDWLIDWLIDRTIVPSIDWLIKLSFYDGLRSPCLSITLGCMLFCSIGLFF